MIADGLREYGLLVAVFIPLDNAFHTHPWPLADTVLLTIGCGGLPFAAGMALERLRPVKEE